MSPASTCWAASVSGKLLLVVIVLVLATEMRSLLIGEAATLCDVDGLRRLIEGDGRVVNAIDVRTQQLGPEELLVGVELELDPSLSGVELTDVLEEIEGSHSQRRPGRGSRCTWKRTPPMMAIPSGGVQQ